MTLRIKINDKIIILSKLYFRQYYITKKLHLQGYCCGLRIRIRIRFYRIRIWIQVTKKRIRPDPNPFMKIRKGDQNWGSRRKRTFLK